MTEEELAEKEANRTGQTMQLRKKKGNELRSRSRSLSLSAIMSANGETAMEGHSRSRNRRDTVEDLDYVDDDDAAGSGDVQKEKRGMILPFQPLAISFDDVSYFVDMPAVRALIIPTPPLEMHHHVLVGGFYFLEC